jgi:hypothetical protein
MFADAEPFLQRSGGIAFTGLMASVRRMSAVPGAWRAPFAFQALIIVIWSFRVQ